MKRTTKLFLAVAALAALAIPFAGPAAASSSDAVLDLPAALLRTTQDRAAYNSNPTPCRVDFLAAQGAPMVDFVVGATRAQDHAVALGECVSLDENARYTTRYTITFQYYDRATGQFVDIAGSKTCTTASTTAGQSALNCDHSKIYDFSDTSINKVHRAKVVMTLPFPLPPNYSDPFLSINATDSIAIGS